MKKITSQIINSKFNNLRRLLSRKWRLETGANYLLNKRRLVIIVLVLFIFTILVSPHSGAGAAWAASSKFYPAYCLGGWHNPQLASGEPNVGQGSSADQFTSENSAVLEGSLSQIYCGYFSSEQQTNPPQRAVFTLSWLVKVPASNNVSGYNSSGQEVKIENSLDQSAPQILPEINTDSSASNPEVPIDNNSLSPEQTIPDDASKQQSWLRFLGTPAYAQETEEPANQSSEEVLIPDQSAVEIPKDILPPATPVDEELKPEVLPESNTASNQENQVVNEISPNNSLNQGGFAEISYSLNGVDWQLLQRIDFVGWSQFSAIIPINSWQDLQNLQITISALSTIDAQPVIYLDGMWLEVEYDRTFTEAVSDVGESVVGVGESIAEVADAVLSQAADLTVSIGDQLADTLTSLAQDIVGDSQEQISEPQVPPIETLVEEPLVAGVTQEKKIITEKVFTFTVDQNTEPVERFLPWLSREQISDLGGEQALSGIVEQSPEIIVGEGAQSLLVKGNCSKDYGVVLLYRNLDDYQKQPTAFVFNHAQRCVEGNFSYLLNYSSLDINPGAYYLLLAEEDKDGPWVPTSSLLPITITEITIDKEISEELLTPVVEAIINQNQN